MEKQQPGINTQLAHSCSGHAINTKFGCSLPHLDRVPSNMQVLGSANEISAQVFAFWLKRPLSSKIVAREPWRVAACLLSLPLQIDHAAS